MANSQAFRDRHRGHLFGITGHVPGQNDYGQCTAIDHAWQTEELGYPIEYGNAVDLLTNANPDLYTVIHNTPDGVPSPVQPVEGDILVWRANDKVIGTGPYAHTAEFVSGDINNRFTSFDQNWPTGSAPHEQVHTYHGVAGWLHPKVLNPPPLPVDPPTPPPAPIPIPVSDTPAPAPSPTPQPPVSPAPPLDPDPTNVFTAVPVVPDADPGLLGRTWDAASTEITTYDKAIAGGLTSAIVGLGARYGFHPTTPTITAFGVLVTAVVGYVAGHLLVYITKNKKKGA